LKNYSKKILKKKNNYKKHTTQADVKRKDHDNKKLLRGMPKEKSNNKTRGDPQRNH
jgi:hypothetical protein